MASCFNLAFFLLCCYFVSGVEKKQIYLLSLLPYYHPDPALNPSWNVGHDIQPALQLAQDQINNSSKLLENYSLQLVYADGGCDISSVVTVSFVQEAYLRDRRLTGILGPGCSLSTATLAAITERPQLGLVTLHGAGSPMFANRTNYRYLLGALGTTDNFVNDELVNLLRDAEWKRVAVLYDKTRVFHQSTKRTLLEEIQQVNDTMVEFLAPVSPTFLPFQALEESRLRVVLVMCPAALSRKILCLAYNRSDYYDTYQWVFVAHERIDLQQETAFSYDGIDYSCSQSNMATALEGSILITYSLTPADAVIPVSNTSHEDYLVKYGQYREIYNKAASRTRNSTYSFWSTYLYDSVWAWALVLDNLTKSREDFQIDSQYGNLEQSKMIVEQFYNTRFQGMSGEISFERNTGYTMRAVKSNRNDSTSYIEDSFPTQYVKQSRVIGALGALAALIQFFASLFLHILTVRYRERPTIKASCPKLLHISYTGIYLILVGIFLNFLYQTYYNIDLQLGHYFCQLLWGWCLPIGFMLAMAPVAMRTWRVYRIFKHYLNPGPLISNPILITAVLISVLPILIVSTVWTVVDSFRLEEVYDFSTRSHIMRVKMECICSYLYVWLGIIMTYIVASLLLFAVFSLLTRKIPNSSFATTALRVLSYIMALAFLLGFPLFYIFNSVSFNPNYSFVVMVILFNFLCAVFISCVFIPPLLPILRHFRQKVRKMSTVTISSGISIIYSPH